MMAQLQGCAFGKEEVLLRGAAVAWASFHPQLRGEFVLAESERSRRRAPVPLCPTLILQLHAWQMPNVEQASHQFPTSRARASTQLRAGLACGSSSGLAWRFFMQLQR
ncbi:unnamed protein product [Durusdinium trenchii]|uniref:Uncharacterized protein n=1 Tax=Durusdinium trenchii TaxID=1381693 RepID=A0ABP0IDB0_9DINO